MATLKNTTIQGTGSFQLAKGPISDRPVTKSIVETFTTVGTTSWTAPTGVTNVEVLVVAGGGSGTTFNPNNFYGGGGGGAGGLLYNNAYTVIPGNSYTVTVGAGGAVKTTSGAGNDGGNSVFDNLTAIGGGGAGRLETAGRSGGSGGGAGGHASIAGLKAGGSGTPGQGFEGGSQTGNQLQSGGGGGGAGQKGTNNQYDIGGGGGNGLNFSISGSPTWYAGGGGGGATSTSHLPGAAGLGGGGLGGNSSQIYGYDGVNGTGGGAGGHTGGSSTALNTSAKGGDGIVIIRYELPVAASPEGTIRYNTELNDIEVYEGTEWKTASPLKNFGGHNLARYSGNVGTTADSTWSVFVGTDTVTQDAAEDPFKGNSATIWHGNGSTSARHSFHLLSPGHRASRTYCFSVFLKARGSQQYITLENASYSNWANPRVYRFDLVNGLYVDNDNRGGIISYGDGWYRCYANATSGSSAFASGGWYINLTDSGYGSNNQIIGTGDGLFLYGAQDEEGVLTPGPYVETGSRKSPVPEAIGGYRVHAFTEVGTSGFTPAVSGFVEVLVVAGGGAGGGYGGNDGSGGGGAGGLVYKEKFPVVSNQRYNVVVGAGGAGVGGAATGNNGSNSIFADIVALGGGGGGTEGATGTREGRAGGSGGGGGGYGAKNGGPGTVGQGFYGGDCTGPGDGGGGGAGGGGANGRLGNGGHGLYFEQFTVWGSPPGWFGGGGGSSGDNRNTFRGGAGAVGGFGGGGKGQNTTDSTPPTSGIANTGGGGGGAAGSNPTHGAGTTLTSGAGGSGIVLVQYQYD